MTDPLVIFTPSGKRGHVAAGTTVLDAARQLGVDLDSVCGGRGICSKCQVQPGIGSFPKHGIAVADDALSDVNAVEQRYDEKRGLKPGRRLGCQACIQSDVLLDVPPESQLHKQVVRKAATQKDIRLDPAIRLVYVEVAQPDMHDPSGDLERLKSALQDQWQIEDLRIDLTLLKTLQTTLRKGNWTVTAALYQTEGPPRLVALWPGLYEGPVAGIAIDLGSTTIAGHLCDLRSGSVLASSGLMNPQIRFGEDLMSRVSYAMMTENGADEMTRAVREGLGDLVRALAAEVGIPPEVILDVTLVCNPVMHHLLLGIDPYELGQAPFALATADALTLTGGDLDLPTAPTAGVYILPCIAGHVGADAAAVALSEAPDQAQELTLIVDVGTNAEILLGHKGRVLACSSPTGPAFEGAQISGGQRAAPGAIERVEIDTASKKPRFQVIGSELWSTDPAFDHPVTGICGSGIIEVIAEMRRVGLLDASGLIGSRERTGSDQILPDGRTHAFLLHDGEPQIIITNSDIRAIQMAKAALYAGARLLMNKFETDTVDRIVLAGAFGAHISPEHALILGMIPDTDPSKITSAGNAAGTGARIALLDKSSRPKIERLVRQIEKIETAIEPRFQEHFVAASAIPNSADSFALTRARVALPEPRFQAGGDRSRRQRRARNSSSQ
ncbi:ASKHA domain-containing protein [Aestuariibius insulae]|uniref:ASKHA domain-containing protein n=1 Tax=Aestuariibius insulae TaxID=2058287 RepID=UPI00345ED5DD